jgi:ribosomal protein L11 methyltransferase
MPALDPARAARAGGSTYPLDLHGAACRIGWEGAVADDGAFLGAAETPSEGDAIRLWFASEPARRRVAAALRRWIVSGAHRTAPGDPGRASDPGMVRCAPPEPSRDWTAAYRSFFPGVRIGGFFVHPPHVPAAPGHTPLTLTPGPAFGTGMHPTTRMVLESLERQLRNHGSATRVLDIGTGSGILAVAAALLDAGSVVAIDLDPAAIRCAEETAAANRVADRIHFRTGDFRSPALAAELKEQDPDGFDLVLANLSSAALTDLWEPAKSLLRPRGRLVISGFLRDEADRVLGAFPNHLLRTAELRMEHSGSANADPWVAATLERRIAGRVQDADAAAAG